MARAQVSFVQLYDGVRIGGSPNPILRRVTSTLALIDVAETATAAEDRPEVPSPADNLSQLYARVTALEGNIMVAWGDDPTASETEGLLILANSVEVIPVRPGEKLSFIAVSPADDGAGEDTAS